MEMEITKTIDKTIDRNVRESMADALADELDKMNIDWENDDAAMEYYVYYMKRIWGEDA